MRASLLSGLMIGLVGAGVTCFSWGTNLLPMGEEANRAAQCGAVLVLMGAAAGMMAVTGFRRESTRLREQLATLARNGKSGYLETTGRELTHLVKAINELLGAAERQAADALMRAKELEIQLKVATAQRQHAQAIIYSISDAVLVTDSFDQIMLANDAAARTFEFDLSQATRQPVSQLVRDQTFVELIREMRQSGSTAGRRIIEHQVKTPQGEKTFKVTFSTVSDRREQPAGVVAVLHDMTREREVAEMKNDFVSSVSHELRTPLASIKAYVEMLIDGEAEDEKTKRDFYEVIQNEANRLSRLIDNILNISRIESGLVKINRQPQSLGVILREALEVIAPQARGKQITLEATPPPVFYQTYADKDMLYQAVLNLMSNAVKYTPEGGRITVTANVDEARRKINVRISDTGVGIPAKDLPFVFDKFYRSEANNRMAKGTGLGLSLVKQIIESVHHGRILVESTVGKGSTFGFELDLCE
jgi:two-component system phosphate regulon sensor histidine kinase PhoR